MPTAPRHSPSRRRLLLGAAASLAVGTCAPSAAAAERNPALRLIGESRLPQAFRFRDTLVGGLSGLDYDPRRDQWLAISDRGEKALCYALRLDISADGLGAPELTAVTPLDGPSHPNPESIRLRPDTDTLLWSTEGQVHFGAPPALHESTRDGVLRRSFALPPHFASAPGRGPRANLGFEGLALTPDGAQAWAAMENALLQDGTEPAVGRPGGPCRLTLFDLASGQALAQRAYVPEAIPHAPTKLPPKADNGVSEILMLDAGHMLVLERAYVSGRGNTLRLFRVVLASGDDTLAMDRLLPGQYRPLAKTLVADLSAYLGPGLSRLDNAESLAWGPQLPAAGGRPAQRTLVLLSDNNFNASQVTQFVAFAVTEPL